MAIFAVRLSREKREISQVEIMGKFAGAVGNYNAHLVAYPDIEWPQIAEEFVTSLGLHFNPYVTQVCFTHSKNKTMISSDTCSKYTSCHKHESDNFFIF